MEILQKLDFEDAPASKMWFTGEVPLLLSNQNKVFYTFSC